MSADPALKQRIETHLRAKFPGETVDVSDGHGDNVHVIVVSHQFQGMSEKEKQDMLWGAIDDSDLSEAEKVKISLILPYSPRELK